MLSHLEPDLALPTPKGFNKVDEKNAYVGGGEEQTSEDSPWGDLPVQLCNSSEQFVILLGNKSTSSMVGHPEVLLGCLSLNCPTTALSAVLSTQDKGGYC